MSKSLIQSVHKWHQTKLGLLLFGLTEGALAYGLFYLSTDSGNLLFYFLTLVFLVGSLQNIFKLLRKIVHDTQASRAR